MPRRPLIPVVILTAGLLLTGAAAWYAARSSAQQDGLRFEHAADRVAAQIDGSIDAYIAMLLGAAGLFAASDDVQLPEFRAYVERLDLPRRYPGVQGIGFSRVVTPEQRDRVAAEVRRYIPSFRFLDGNPQETVHAIVYLEPQDERNRRAMGFDMFAEPTRRAAMVRACDTAAPAATERVTLRQEIDPGARQGGLLIYVPVYRGGAVPATVEERRKRLFGFVYSPFRAYDLLRGILGGEEGEVSFDVYVDSPATQNLLHRGRRNDDEPRFRTERLVGVAGTQWTLDLRSGPAFPDPTGRALVPLVIIVGSLLSALLYVSTMTQVKAREAAEQTAEELRRSEEALRDADRAKDEFLAVVSHELRTPLNAIVGWAGMLRRGQVPEENRAHAISVIERNAVAQVHLVEDLLDLSRAVAGRLSLDVIDVDVAAALRAAADAVAPAAQARGVHLTCRVPSELGRVRADQARLQQIVLNLLSNGIKFTPEGGRVTLSAARSRDSVSITVADTGVGIGREFLPHIFERFRQADTSSTRAHGGIGLGLAISRHLVELHGGWIEAVSEGVGRGTTVTVHLPSVQVPHGALAGVAAARQLT
jgi:signal transduction histidine kinase